MTSAIEKQEKIKNILFNFLIEQDNSFIERLKEVGINSPEIEIPASLLFIYMQDSIIEEGEDIFRKGFLSGFPKFLTEKYHHKHK